MQTTVLSNSNEIRNKVLEGMTEIKNSVIDAETETKKAYQKMAQEVEKWHIAFQDKAYDSGIGKGMTKKGQLNKYRSFMTENLVDLASKYGINADQLFAMQNGYTAEGRSKLLNRKDLENSHHLVIYTWVVILTRQRKLQMVLRFLIWALVTLLTIWEKWRNRLTR